MHAPPSGGSASPFDSHPPASTSRRFLEKWPPPVLPEDTAKEWNFTAFEWTVKDVAKLNAAVQARDTSEQDAFALMKESPLIGDGKYKVEIGA